MNFSFMLATHPGTFLVIYDKIVDGDGKVIHKARKLEIPQGSVCFFRGDMVHSGPWFLPAKDGPQIRLHSHLDNRSCEHTGEVGLAVYDSTDFFDFSIVAEECLPFDVVDCSIMERGG